MKLLNNIKKWIFWIVGIAGSIFVFVKLFGQKKQDINVDRLKGQNDILNDNINSNDIEIGIINGNLDSVKENISEIKEEKNSEELDDFFDKRGF